jgi:hypothetical protein
LEDPQPINRTSHQSIGEGLPIPDHRKSLDRYGTPKKEDKMTEGSPTGSFDISELKHHIKSLEIEDDEVSYIQKVEKEKDRKHVKFLQILGNCLGGRFR